VYGAIVAAGWFAANLSAVPYFFNIGTGALTWNTINHILNGLVNITLGLILGYYFSGLGVVIAAAFALVIPNLMLIQVVNQRLQLGVTAIVPSGQRAYLIIVSVGAALAYAARPTINNYFAGALAAALPIALFTAITLAALAINPAAHSIFVRFSKRNSK
jgi:hypothetical protein